MQISSRFTMAVHILTCIETFENQYKVTSEFLASSINVNAVIIRKLLLQLKAAKLISVARGTGGTSLLVPADKITFLDIYHAVESEKDIKMFRFHENPNPECPIGRNIHQVMDEKLLRVQSAMEAELSAITLADVINDTKEKIRNEK